MLQRLKVTSYALLILLLLVLPSQADEYCTTADMCAAAAQAAGKMLGNKGKNGISGYPFVLETNTYGCWYYPDSHGNKNYAGSAFWGAASSEAQMRDPDPGAAHHVRLKCGGGGPATITKRKPMQAKPDPHQAQQEFAAKHQARRNEVRTLIGPMCNAAVAVCASSNGYGGYGIRGCGMKGFRKLDQKCQAYCLTPRGHEWMMGKRYPGGVGVLRSNDWKC